MLRPRFPTLALAAALLLGGCGQEEAGNDAAAVPAAEAAPSDAELAQDSALANEAAADEAADMEAFGGNAAATEGENRQ